MEQELEKDVGDELGEKLEVDGVSGASNPVLVGPVGLRPSKEELDRPALAVEVGDLVSVEIETGREQEDILLAATTDHDQSPRHSVGAVRGVEYEGVLPDRAPRSAMHADLKQRRVDGQAAEEEGRGFADGLEQPAAGIAPVEEIGEAPPDHASGSGALVAGAGPKNEGVGQALVGIEGEMQAHPPLSLPVPRPQHRAQRSEE